MSTLSGSNVRKRPTFSCQLIYFELRECSDQFQSPFYRRCRANSRTSTSATRETFARAQDRQAEKTREVNQYEPRSEVEEIPRRCILRIHAFVSSPLRGMSEVPYSIRDCLQSLSQRVVSYTH